MAVRLPYHLLLLLLSLCSCDALVGEELASSAVSLPPVRIISPQEGEELLLDERGQVEFRIGAGNVGEGEDSSSSSYRGGFALYLDGVFVQSESLPHAGNEFIGKVPLGEGRRCGQWHFVEVVLVDEEGWKVEGEGSSVWVSFKSACSEGGGEDRIREEERRRVFQHVYNTYGWDSELEGTRESRSGPGSFLSRTNTSRSFLADVIKRYNITSVLDAGCGDLNWQKHVEELRNVEYVGVDIVPELIENNKKQFKEWKKMRFETMDIVREPIGRSFDLIVCRDTLFHLPVFDAVQALKNFDASKSKFLLSHFDEELTSNWPDIKVGGWHLINLLEAPFKLSAPVEMVVEKGQDEQSKVQNHYGHARRLALWKLPAMKHTGEATRCQKTRREAASPGGRSVTETMRRLKESGRERRCLLAQPLSGGSASTAEPTDLVICDEGAANKTEGCDFLVSSSGFSFRGEVARAGAGAGAGWEKVHFSQIASSSFSSPLEGLVGRVFHQSHPSPLALQQKLLSLLLSRWLSCSPILLPSNFVLPSSSEHAALREVLEETWKGGQFVFHLTSTSSPPSPADLLPPLSPSAAFFQPAPRSVNGAIVCIIPARFGSQRFPGKLLEKLKGKTVLERTWRRAGHAEACRELVVATDSKEIMEHVRSFGGRAVMTRSSWRSGTERVYEGWRLLEDSWRFEYVINVQGDEPLLNPAHIDALAEQLRQGKHDMSTLAIRISYEEASNPGVVKVILDAHDHALYFSRSLIPSVKNVSALPASRYLRHIGIYGFHGPFLERYISLPDNFLQRSEDLEQLKVLGAGHNIHVSVVEGEVGPDVNTQEDLERVEGMIAQ